jgi:hypothetical protein|tara:strand:- start:753 stop:857 length:105 start_codon:yes stop_codon:yes gene_type:complete
MDKLKYFYKGLSKRGKIVTGVIIVILVMCIYGMF